MTVPARFRDTLTALCAGQVTITKHPTGCLQLLPRPTWLEFRTKLLGLPMEADGWRRIYIGSAMDVEIDSGSRVLLSPELRAWAGLDKEVTLMGLGSRLEIWDRQRQAANELKTLAGGMPASLAGVVL